MGAAIHTRPCGNKRLGPVCRLQPLHCPLPSPSARLPVAIVYCSQFAPAHLSHRHDCLRPRQSLGPVARRQTPPPVTPTTPTRPLRPPAEPAALELGRLHLTAHCTPPLHRRPPEAVRRSHHARRKWQRAYACAWWSAWPHGQRPRQPSRHGLRWAAKPSEQQE